MIFGQILGNPVTANKSEGTRAEKKYFESVIHNFLSCFSQTHLPLRTGKWPGHRSFRLGRSPLQRQGDRNTGRLPVYKLPKSGF